MIALAVVLLVLIAYAVGWLHGWYLSRGTAVVRASEPTAPTPAQQRLPLTDQSDDELMREMHRSVLALNLAIRAARLRGAYVALDVASTEHPAYPGGLPEVYVSALRYAPTVGRVATYFQSASSEHAYPRPEPSLLRQPLPPQGAA